MGGGGILLQNSNISIIDTIFTQNQARMGGAMSILCSSVSPCSVSLRDTRFSSNIGHEQGGAIYYNWNRPNLENITFNSNSALYGPDIASYAVKIVDKGTQTNKISKSDIASGVTYPRSLEFELLDYDGQVMNLENSYIIKISPEGAGTSVRGNDFARIQNGTATISDVIFESQAGDTGINYM